jgi:hypothetical protein
MYGSTRGAAVDHEMELAFFCFLPDKEWSPVNVVSENKRFGRLSKPGFGI